MNGVFRSCKITQTSGALSALKRCVMKNHSGNRMFSTFQTSHLGVDVINWNSVTPWNKKRLPINHYSTQESKIINNQIAEFLEHEIEAEQEQRGNKTIPSKIDDFDVKLDGAFIKLVKISGDETIKIEFSVNDSVSLNSDTEYEGNLVSTPKFDVDITKGGSSTLGFSCSFNVNVEEEDLPERSEEAEADLFIIDSLAVFSGEYQENTYTAGGDVLDGNLYNLLMSFLESKGINDEFITKVSELSTIYEQSLYISMLRGLKKFVT